MGIFKPEVKYSVKQQPDGRREVLERFRSVAGTYAISHGFFPTVQDAEERVRILAIPPLEYDERGKRIGR